MSNASTCVRGSRPFCVCNSCTREKAAEHVDADHRLGREWSCQCGACRIVRRASDTFEVDRRLDRLDGLQRRLAAVRSIKGVQ